MSPGLSFRSLAGDGEPISGARFDDEDLAELAFADLDVSDCEFHSCDFRATSLRTSRFVRCRFVHSSFLEGRFADVRFSGGEDGSHCVWAFSRLDDAEFKDCNLNLNVLTKCSAHRATFDDCAATGLKFDAAVHRRVRGRRLSGGVTFRRCKLIYSVFDERNLEESCFDGSDLRDARFAGLNLARASFRGCNLANVDFAGSALDDAVLCEAVFDRFSLQDLRSFHGMMVSADSQATMLASVGIRVGT